MNNKLTIGITGAGGHIGSQLTEYLRGKAFEVIVLTKNVDSIKDTSARKYDLTDAIADDLLNDIDVLIHCAYIGNERHEDAAQINYNGSKLLFEASRKQGVKKIIFFSSVTANANAASGYARSKFAIEQLLDANTDFIIRCSMVIGSGGLFKRMLTYALTHRLIPLVGSGNQIVQVVAIVDVVRFVEQIIINDLTGTGVLANEERLTYRQLFTTIADVYQKRIVFVRVPAAALKIILRLNKFLGIRTGASEENVQGIQTLHPQKPLLLLPSYRSLEETLEGGKG
jgi:nucleoside-diphosphate-sugar epimerase